MKRQAAAIENQQARDRASGIRNAMKIVLHPRTSNVDEQEPNRAYTDSREVRTWESRYTFCDDISRSKIHNVADPCDLRALRKPPTITVKPLRRLAQERCHA